jgi:hypothetical protein
LSRTGHSVRGGVSSSRSANERSGSSEAEDCDYNGAALTALYRTCARNVYPVGLVEARGAGGASLVGSTGVEGGTVMWKEAQRVFRSR